MATLDFTPMFRSTIGFDQIPRLFFPCAREPRSVVARKLTTNNSLLVDLSSKAPGQGSLIDGFENLESHQ
jgi:hypothetical protein